MKKIIFSPNFFEKGYLALTSLLIISATVLLVAISAIALGISESTMGLQKNQSEEAFYLASACAERALMNLKNGLDYPGNETLVIDAGSCYIAPLEGSGNENRIVKTTGTIYNQIRKIQIVIAEVNPAMQISSWQEVADF